MTAWAATAIRNRYPDAFLVWATEGRCAPVIDRHRLVTQRHEFPRDKWKLRRWSPQTWRDQLSKFLRLRQLGFDYGFDFQGHSKTALCLYLARPRQRISGGGTDGLASRLNPIHPGRSPGDHTIEWNHHVLQSIGEFELPVRPILPAVHAERERNLITISVSAGHPSKTYPLERWREIARNLIEDGYRVSFLGGPSDPNIDLPGSEDLVGKLRLKDTLAQVGKSALHLAADTGTGHMAAALGTPVVSVFGPMDPSVYRPYTDQGTVLRVTADPASVPMESVLTAARSHLAGAIVK
jgi:ADP-heptose:LPS heptosyltransferase